MLVTLLGIGDMALDKTDNDLAHKSSEENNPRENKQKLC